MTNQKNFKGQFEDELVLCFFRKHWIAILPRVLALVALMFVLILGIRYFMVLAAQEAFINGLIIAAHILVTYLIHRQFLAIFQYFLHCVLITNYRIVDVDKSVFFRDSKDSVDLARVQDIRKIQNGVFENVLHFGTLVIILSGTHATVTIDLVPRPDYQFKKINKVKQLALSHRHRPLPAEPVVEATEPTRVGGEIQAPGSPIQTM
jgi:hypothetical protein